MAEPLRHIFGVAAVVASGGLALEDVDVEDHNVFPESVNGNALVNYLVASSILGDVQKSSPSCLSTTFPDSVKFRMLTTSSLVRCSGFSPPLPLSHSPPHETAQPDGWAVNIWLPEQDSNLRQSG